MKLSEKACHVNKTFHFYLIKAFSRRGTFFRQFGLNELCYGLCYELFWSCAMVVLELCYGCLAVGLAWAGLAGWLTVCVRAAGWKHPAESPINICTCSHVRFMEACWPNGVTH